MKNFGLRSLVKVATGVSPRGTILLAGSLFLTQVVVLAEFGNRQLGAVLSELIQLMLGFICLLTSVQAFRRSGNVSRYYWRWISLTFCIWIVAQALGAYIDLSLNSSLEPLDNLLFFVSVVPFGMLIFSDPDQESHRFDRLHLLDFLQVCIFWAVVGLYFGPSGTIDVGPFHLTRNLAYDAMLTASFLLRSLLTDSAVVRAFFGRMALFLIFSGMADAYAASPSGSILPGNWFDLVWSLLLGIPILIAATWNPERLLTLTKPNRAQQVIINEFFPLLYPLFTFLMLAQVARSQTVLTSYLMLLTFAGLGARTLIFQHRLLRAQHKLQFEAAHDALTSVWNHGAILDLLNREVERHSRTGDTLGLMMVDLDNFKKVNDTYGHMIGDLALQEVALRLNASMRSYDLIGRYGGEEFLVIAPGCSAVNLLSGGERLRRVVAEQAIETAVGAIPITISIGLVSSLIQPGRSDFLGLLRAADAALYDAKRKGRNRVELSTFQVGSTSGQVASGSAAERGRSYP